MRKFITYITTAICTLCLSYSCTDSFLDKKPYDYSTEGFYSTEEAIELGVTAIYNYMLFDRYSLEYGCPGYVILDTYTGLCGQRNQNTSIGAGEITPTSAEVVNYWKNWYELIGRANTVLYASKDYLDGLKNTKAPQYIAEARTLRAFAYYMLVSIYGDVLLFEEPVTGDMNLASRTDKVTVLDFILSELDEVAEDMPWIATQRGRADRAFAYGLMARAALLGGSLDFGGRGQEYFRTAADAAAKVIGQRHLADNFDDLFTVVGQEKADVRNELIMETMHNDGPSVQRTHVVNLGNGSRFYGQTNRYPTSLIVDIFEDIHGRRIDESTVYNPQKPMENRDPRFRATFWGHGDEISANRSGDLGSLVTFIAEAYENKTLQWSNANQAWEEVDNPDVSGSNANTSFSQNGCGYLLRKFGSDVNDIIGRSRLHIPIMRYAEVLLTYAEAKIELNELDNTVYDAINQVRRRAGMPDVSADRIGNQNRMRQLVRRERKVELFMEGLHFIDMRRWGIGDLENEKPSYGIPNPATRFEGMTASDRPYFNKSDRHDLNDIPNYTYTEKLLMRDPNRFWSDTYRLWPIPQTDRDLNPNLTQNDGYSSGNQED